MSTTFHPDTVQNAVRAASEKVGLRAGDAEPVRPGLYLLPSEDTFAEVRALDDFAELSHEITTSRWLNSAGLPAAEPRADVDQAFPAAGLPVAFWQRFPEEPARFEELGELLRRLHALPVPADLALPEHDVLGRLGPHIESAPISEGDRAFLLSRLQELRDEIDELEHPLQPCAIQGNAHLGAIASSGGNPVLLDIAHFAHGQPEWDLGAIATEHRTAGWWTAEQYRAFADAYGFDVTQWRGFRAIEAVHQIRMTTALVPDVQDDEDVAAEYDSRMRTVRDGAPSTWTPAARVHG